MVNNINNNKPVLNNYAQKSKEKENVDKKQEVANSDKNSVTLELSYDKNVKNSDNKIIYKNDLSINDKNTIDRLWAQTDKNSETVRDMVEKLLKEQGMEFKKSAKGKYDAKVSDEIRQKAEDLISEDGELGIKKVSDRIIEFAKAISGGDKSKIPELRGAIEAGFKAAEKVIGDLPEISNKTHDLIMEKLDEWENSEE